MIEPELVHVYKLKENFEICSTCGSRSDYVPQTSKRMGSIVVFGVRFECGHPSSRSSTILCLKTTIRWKLLELKNFVFVYVIKTIFEIKTTLMLQ